MKTYTYTEALDITSQVLRLATSGKLRSWESPFVMRQTGFVSGWLAAGGSPDDSLLQGVVTSLDNTLVAMRETAGVA